MTQQTFEQYLQDIHSENYMGIDDNMPDDFDTFFSNLDIEEIVGFAESYGNLQYSMGRISGFNKALEIMKE